MIRRLFLLCYLCQHSISFLSNRLNWNTFINFDSLSSSPFNVCLEDLSKSKELTTEHFQIRDVHQNESDIVFVVFGEPIPLSRHMMSNNRMYNPSAKSQKQFLDCCKEYLPEQPFEGPLEISIIFYFTRPKKHFKTGKNAGILRQDAPTWHTSRKDIDNLIKFVLDSLNSKAYVDDKQVASISSRKYYTDDKPRTVVKISRLTESSLGEDQ